MARRAVFERQPVSHERQRTPGSGRIRLHRCGIASSPYAVGPHGLPTPAWDGVVPMTKGMPYFPGTQMQITIPERIGDAAPVATGARASRSRGRVP
jgi:hypothetical protein